MKYLKRCKELLQKSNCILIHFGSVLVKNGKIIGEGYNYSLKDCSSGCLKNKIKNLEVGKNPAVCYAIHSEWMAIIGALKKGYDPNGATLYIIGEYPNGKVWQSKYFACTVCARLLKYCGIKKIIGLQFNRERGLSMDEVFDSAYIHILGEK